MFTYVFREIELCGSIIGDYFKRENSLLTKSERAILEKRRKGSMKKVSLTKRIFALALAICMIASVFLVNTNYADARAALNTSFAVAPKATILDASTVAFTATLPSAPNADDGCLHLFALQVYEYSIPAGATPIASSAMTLTPTMSFALNRGQANTRLYSKFVLAVYQGGVPVMISEPQFVSNPEILATNSHAPAPRTLKGLQGQRFTNLYIGAANEVHPRLMPQCVKVLNTGVDQLLTNPYARPDQLATDTHPLTDAYMYMMNAADAAGVAHLAERMEYFAANAYKTDEWIIGNECNVRKRNQMKWISWDEYMRQYEQVFRICYIAIKSNNANARVMTCIDQNWDRNRPTSHAEYYEFIDGKDFLTMFAADAKLHGDMNWGLAIQPYTVPLTYAQFWNMSGCPDGAYCAQQVNSNKMVSFQNIGTVVSFMQTPAMLTAAGAPRPIIFSELGISATSGDAVQAAALCASYVAAERYYPYIDEIFYVNTSAGAVNGAFGPLTTDMYNNMDGANAAAYRASAMATIGISDWTQILH